MESTCRSGSICHHLCPASRLCLRSWMRSRRFPGRSVKYACSGNRALSPKYRHCPRGTHDRARAFQLLTTVLVGPSPPYYCASDAPHFGCSDGPNFPALVPRTCRSSKFLCGVAHDQSDDRSRQHDFPVIVLAVGVGHQGDEEGEKGRDDQTDDHAFGERVDARGVPADEHADDQSLECRSDDDADNLRRDFWGRHERREAVEDAENAADQCAEQRFIHDHLRNANIARITRYAATSKMNVRYFTNQMPSRSSIVSRCAATD